MLSRSPGFPAVDIVVAINCNPSELADVPARPLSPVVRRGIAPYVYSWMLNASPRIILRTARSLRPSCGEGSRIAPFAWRSSDATQGALVPCESAYPARRTHNLQRRAPAAAPVRSGRGPAARHVRLVEFTAANARSLPGIRRAMPDDMCTPISEACSRLRPCPQTAWRGLRMVTLAAHRASRTAASGRSVWSASGSAAMSLSPHALIGCGRKVNHRDRKPRQSAAVCSAALAAPSSAFNYPA